MEALGKVAAEDEDAAARKAAEMALVALSAPDAAVERVRSLLATGRVEAYEVAGAIRRLGPAAAPLVPQVLALVQGTKGGRFRYDEECLVGALGNLGAAGETAEAGLVARLSDSRPLHRGSSRAAAVALLELGRRRDVALPVVLAALSEEGVSMDLRARALRALAALGPAASAAGPVAEGLVEPYDSSVREAAIEWLRALKKP